MTGVTSALTGAALLAIAATWPAAAQEPGGLARCRSIADSGERLGCYDQLADAARQVPPTAAGHDYQAVSLTDAKLDQDGLRGREVAVSGNLVAVGEVALLRSDGADTSPLVVDLKAVPREQRRAVLERCGALGCAAAVRGRVDRVAGQPGIVAGAVDVR